MVMAIGLIAMVNTIRRLKVTDEREAAIQFKTGFPYQRMTGD